MNYLNWRPLLVAALLNPAVPVLAAGDDVRGQQLYERRCIACHSVDQNRVGPAHQGVYGRKAGGAPNYDYSAALRASKVVWDQATLDRWLTDPQATIPGQKMGYSVADARDRADLIAYLRKVSLQ
jgi:cytochrome c